MKWPLITETWKGANRTLKVEYLTRTTELILNSEKCTTCAQCAKACPKNALVMPTVTPGVKKTKLERLPQFVEPSKCVFCGVCMAMCPYAAIQMQLDGKILTIGDLGLVQGKILPEMTTVKVGKVELKEQGFSTDFFKKLMDRIEIKRAAPKNQ